MRMIGIIVYYMIKVYESLHIFIHETKFNEHKKNEFKSKIESNCQAKTKNSKREM